MNLVMNFVFPYVRNFVKQEEGQDLVEYALIVNLIAFGTIACMGYLATGINYAFWTIATVLTT